MFRPAINALRNLSPFRDVSARLLADLAALGKTTEISASGKTDGIEGSGAIVVALDGRVELRFEQPGPLGADGTTSQAYRASGRVLKPGEARLLDPSLQENRRFEALVTRTAEARILVI